MGIEMEKAMQDFSHSCLRPCGNRVANIWSCMSKQIVSAIRQRSQRVRVLLVLGSHGRGRGVGAYSMRDRRV